LSLVFTVGNTVIGGEPLAALAIGSALMVAVYLGGPISGGHYNPAVSLAVWLRGKLGAAEFLPYIGAQIAGAIVAALLVRCVQGEAAKLAASAAASAKPVAMHAIFIAEFLWTFVLASPVLNVDTTKKAA